MVSLCRIAASKIWRSMLHESCQNKHNGQIKHVVATRLELEVMLLDVVIVVVLVCAELCKRTLNMSSSKKNTHSANKVASEPKNNNSGFTPVQFIPRHKAGLWPATHFLGGFASPV